VRLGARWAICLGLVLNRSVGAAAEVPRAPTTARINGVYRAAENEISLLSLGHGKVRVEFELTNGPSEGYALGDAKLRGDTLVYTEPHDGGCKIELKLLPHDELDVGVLSDCGFPPHNGASGHYRKLKSGPPKLALGAAVPSTATSPREGAPGPAAIVTSLALSVALDRDDAQGLALVAADARAKLEPLLAQHKTAAQSAKDAQKDLNQHATAAENAFHRVQGAGPKKLATPTVQQDLQLARREAELAQKSLAALTPALAAQRVLERELAELAAKAAQAGSDAGSAAKDADAAVASLASSEKALQAAAVKDKQSKQLSSEAARASTARTEAQQLVKQVKAAASATSADAGKARQLTGGSPEQLAQKLTRAQQDDTKLLKQLSDKLAALAKTNAALEPAAAAPPTAQAAPRAASGNPIPGTTDLPAAQLQQRFGNYTDEIMQAHPEIVAAMQAFDRGADVLWIPHESRLVRSSSGREILLLAGRTCRGCGAVVYFVAWDARRKLVAFSSQAENAPPVQGANDAELRALVDKFSSVSFP
jgi:hypothetical protein